MLNLVLDKVHWLQRSPHSREAS